MHLIGIHLLREFTFILRKEDKLKTCENCDFSVVFDRSLSRRSLGNLGCGWLNAMFGTKELDSPQIEPDHTCHYWQSKEEVYDGNQESIKHIIHPWSD